MNLWQALLIPKPPTVSVTQPGSSDANSGSTPDGADFNLGDAILGLIPDNLALDFINNFFENLIDGVSDPGELPGAGDLSPGAPDDGSGINA